MSIIIAPSAIVDPRAELGDGTTIDDFALVGVTTVDPNLEPLRIGGNARIRSHTVIYHGNVIGERFQTGHGVLIRESNRIGADVSVGTHSIIEHHVELHDGVRIHSNAFIPEFSVLGARAWVGPSVTFTNARYPLSPSAKSDLRGPIVGAGAKIGAGSTLLPGVTIGRDALIGAGSVVIHDVPDGAVVVGNPARVVRFITDLEAYRTS